MCERMIQQQLYTSAAVLTAPNDPATSDHRSLSTHTSFRNLLSRLAAHLASEAEASRFDGTLCEDQAPYGEKLLIDGDCFASDEP